MARRGKKVWYTIWDAATMEELERKVNMIDREKLFADNVKLVPFVLWKYYPAFARDEDLIQDGLLALWKACVAYDESRSNAFSTFAVFCIRNGINMALRRRSRWMHTESLDQPIFAGKDGSELYLADMIEDPAAQIDDGIIGIVEFVSGLNGRDKEIIELRMSGLTQYQCAEKLGISQSYYCRLLKRLKSEYESQYA